MNHTVVTITSAAILVLTVAACSSNDKSTISTASSTTSSRTTTTAPTMAASRLESILLTAQEIETIMGIKGIEAGKVYSHLMNMGVNGDTLSNPGCIGALYNVQEPVYAGSGYTAATTQLMSSEGSARYVEQSAAVFNSVDQANAFAAKSADQWSSCAEQTVTRTGGGKKETLTLSQATRGQSRVETDNANERGYTCQHVLRAVSNVIIEAQACGPHPPSPGEANRVVDKIAPKVTP